MTQRCVTDEQYGRLNFRLDDLRRRIKQGTIPFESGMAQIQQIIEGSLIHGMFLSAEQQLLLVREQNRELGWSFTEADFEQLGSAPCWPTDSKLAVVILDVSLADVATTFDTAWNFAKAVQPNEWRWDQLLSDSEHLRLLSGKTHQRGLRWRIVDLGANTNRKPIDVRNATTSPDSAILWMALYSPKWIQAMDGSTIPYVWLPGYEVSIPDGSPWADVPFLLWHRDARKVKLGASDADRCHGNWAVPVLREL